MNATTSCPPAPRRLTLLPALRTDAGWMQRSLQMMRGWRQRMRSRQSLAEMDARMLKDIGLTRADVIHETDKPFWVR